MPSTVLSTVFDTYDSGQTIKVPRALAISVRLQIAEKGPFCIGKGQFPPLSSLAERVVAPRKSLYQCNNRTSICTLHDLVTLASWLSREQDPSSLSSRHSFWLFPFLIRILAKFFKRQQIRL